MTVKELKEKIIENEQNNYLGINLMEMLKLLDENSKVELLIKSPMFTTNVKRYLKDLLNKYDNTLVEEVKKFIDLASKILPNFVFEYKLITEKVARVDYKYISNNTLKCGKVYFRKGYSSMSYYCKCIERILIEYYK